MIRMSLHGFLLAGTVSPTASGLPYMVALTASR